MQSLQSPRSSVRIFVCLGPSVPFAMHIDPQKLMTLVYCVTSHPLSQLALEKWRAGVTPQEIDSMNSYDWSSHKCVSTCIIAFLHQFLISAKQRRSHFDAWASRQVTLTPSMFLVSLVNPNCQIWDWQVLFDSIIKKLVLVTCAPIQTNFLKDLQHSNFQFDIRGIQLPQKPLAERDASNVAAAARSMQLRSLSQSGSSEPPQKGSQGPPEIGGDAGRYLLQREVVLRRKCQNHWTPRVGISSRPTWSLYQTRHFDPFRSMWAPAVWPWSNNLAILRESLMNLTLIYWWMCLENDLDDKNKQSWFRSRWRWPIAALLVMFLSRPEPSPSGTNSIHSMEGAHKFIDGIQQKTELPILMDDQWSNSNSNFFWMPHIIRELQLSLRAPVQGENTMIEKNLRVRIHALRTWLRYNKKTPDLKRTSLHT